jgi:hypothetical protein
MIDIHRLTVSVTLGSKEDSRETQTRETDNKQASRDQYTYVQYTDTMEWMYIARLHSKRSAENGIGRDMMQRQMRMRVVKNTLPKT